LDEVVTDVCEVSSDTKTHKTSWSVFAVFVIATLVRGTGAFMYDAQFYWLAAERVVGSSPTAPEGFWEIRGVLTAFVYTPAAALGAVIGPEAAGFAVLLQNSLFLAWFAAFLLPRFVGRWQTVSTRARWLGAFLSWVVVSGFAPFPLVDIYPAVACFAILVLLRSERSLALLLAGLVGGISINLRPAYLVTVALLVLLALAWRRWAGVLMPVGVALALIPQAVFSTIKFGHWSVLPPASGALMALQTSLASYSVRYDTLFAAPQPQQFYCSPAMAQELGSPLPTTMGNLASTFLTHFPTSAVFSLEKVAAALHWPLSTPYTTPMAGLDALFAISITGVTVVGVAVLIRHAAQGRGTWSTSSWFGWATIAVAFVSGIITLVSSATESRFALPLVLLGTIGCTMIADRTPREAWERGRWWVLGTLAIVVAVSALGYAGLSHPAPPGTFDLATCAST
jgi:hypothetical protein